MQNNAFISSRKLVLIVALAVAFFGLGVSAEQESHLLT